jgi:hypothetical protein
MKMCRLTLPAAEFENRGSSIENVDAFLLRSMVGRFSNRLSAGVGRHETMSTDRQAVLKFESAGQKWWNKPLVLFWGRHTTAELAILSMETGSGECGAWLNSRGTKTGAVDLVTSDTNAIPTYRTRRVSLPDFVSNTLVHLYRVTGLTKGCPDLVIWDTRTKELRLVEVKCPHWDKPSHEQDQFLRAASSLGVRASIVEWEFGAAQPGAAADRPTAASPLSSGR